MYGKLFIIFLYSSLLFSKTVISTDTVVCCAARDTTFEINNVLGLSRGDIMRYMDSNDCTMVAHGQKVDIIKKEDGLVRINSFYGKYWCPAKIN